MRVRNKKLFKYIIVLLFFVVVGYTALVTNISINGTSTFNSNTWNVYFTNLVVDADNNVTGTQTITNNTTVDYTITLSKPGDTYSFTVDAVNEGSIDAMVSTKTLSEIDEQYENLIEYTATYSDGVEIAQYDKLAKTSGSETVKVTVHYKEDVTASDLPCTAINLSLTFNITYVQADENAKDVLSALDDFIVRSKAGNVSASDVGKTFTVDLGDTYGEHTIRVANVSNPDACSGDDFSQTACGVVLEFADIITDQAMNSTDTNVGGWPASELRTFVNDTIYNSLPTNIKNAIIDTTVVSGHGPNSGEENFTSTDKLYLLSSHEVWEDGSSHAISSYDTAYIETKQLDYYANNNVTTSSYSSAIKQDGGSDYFWWLRSVNSTMTSKHFLIVGTTGDWSRSTASNPFGVSPAFRIEYNPQYVSNGTDLGDFIARAKAGNATSADVGTTFTVDLGDTYGEHTLRVANVSTPTECSNNVFSQTACGVVLEFADIITEYKIKNSDTNSGGWPETLARTFVNDTIYNSLPTNLKSAIINTTVISGHGKTDSSNFTSTDKLYLLSNHEIWEDSDGNETSGINYYDASYDYTRQLDYYSEQNVTTNSYAYAIKKLDGTAKFYWLRSAHCNFTYVFYGVSSSGDVGQTNADSIAHGISPAFRVA